MQLKNLINILKFGGRFMITDENGDPKAVLMSYDEFEDLMTERVAGDLAAKLDAVEKVNAEITRAQIHDLREEVMREDFVGNGVADLTVEPLSDNLAEFD